MFALLVFAFLHSIGYGALRFKKDYQHELNNMKSARCVWCRSEKKEQGDAMWRRTRGSQDKVPGEARREKGGPKPKRESSSKL